ncbi:spheroidene monooxygenase [Alsobacter sp. R-9]
MQAISISFFRFDGLAARLWAFAQMQFARGKLRRTPGIGFFKLFGTGTGEGFTPVPNFGVYAVLATWPDLETARRAVAEGRAYRDYRAHAVEHATIYLSAVASRGRWDSQEPFEVFQSEPQPSPIAVLTRATVRGRHLFRFWGRTPDISSTVRGEDHLRFKIGMGEVPWIQQVTFSVWDDPASMVSFAYRSASHGEAVKRVRSGKWFKEELYARFRILDWDGTWEGRAPIPGFIAHHAV